MENPAQTLPRRCSAVALIIIGFYHLQQNPHLIDHIQRILYLKDVCHAHQSADKSRQDEAVLHSLSDILMPSRDALWTLFTSRLKGRLQSVWMAVWKAWKVFQTKSFVGQNMNMFVSSQAGIKTTAADAVGHWVSISARLFPQNLNAPWLTTSRDTLELKLIITGNIMHVLYICFTEEWILHQVENINWIIRAPARGWVGGGMQKLLNYRICRHVSRTF